MNNQENHPALKEIELLSNLEHQGNFGEFGEHIKQLPETVLKDMLGTLVYLNANIFNVLTEESESVRLIYGRSDSGLPFPKVIPK